VREIIENEKIKLSMSEKFRYYRFSIISLIITIFCLTNGFTKLPFEKFNLTESKLDKIGVFSFFFILKII
jgi:hypothetical protein